MAEMTYKDDLYKVATIDLPWTKLDGCNILVTGATGLIGNCLVDVLMAHPNKTYSVFALGRNVHRLNQLYAKYEKDDSFSLINGDITSPVKATQSFDFIVHAASGAAPVDFANHPVEVMKANLLGLVNLMEYGLSHGLKRMLYISSGEVYGEGDGRVFTEDYSGYVNPMSPRSCYPSSKRAAESLCSSYVSEYNADIVVARPCHVYGPHFTDSDNRAFAQFIRNILHDEDIVLKSSGEQFRSWCYVIDCVSGLLHILLKGERGEAYNIADPASNVSIRELANLIATIGNRGVIVSDPSLVEKKGFNPVSKSVYSIRKIQTLDWNPLFSLREGFEHTIKELL